MSIKSVVLITIESLNSHHVQVVGGSQAEAIYCCQGALSVQRRLTVHGKAIVRISVVNTRVQKVVALRIIASVKGFGIGT